MPWQTKSPPSFVRVFAAATVLIFSLGQGLAQTPTQPRSEPLNPELIREATATLNPKTKVAIADEELERRLAEYKKQPSTANREALSGWLETRRQLSGTTTTAETANASGTVKSIKSNPLFRDSGDAQDSNWIQTVFKRLGSLRMPKMRAPEGNLPGFSLPAFITPLMWTLLAGLVAFFGYQVAKHVQLKQRIKRKSAGLLEENEPVRSQSEWLALANQHEAAGEFREAVRCLYIAMLLTFDEFRVARFDRRQTNWEHLTRIEASPIYSAEVGFRHLTQRFDRIWYGHQTRGADDVTEFRAAFADINSRWKGIPA